MAQSKDDDTLLQLASQFRHDLLLLLPCESARYLHGRIETYGEPVPVVWSVASVAVDVAQNEPAESPC